MDSMVLALIILGITIILFAFEPIPIVVTAIGASIAYAYTGIIKIEDVFSGYNSNTIVLLAAMMVVGSSLFHSGVTDKIGTAMLKITGRNERNIILISILVTALLSGICSNIGVMVAFAPLVTAMCLAAGVSISRALLGVLFGAQLGGFITLVGVGSNVAAANAMVELGYESFGFFDITPFGIGVTIIGSLYYAFIGKNLIPDTGYVPEFAKIEKKFDKKNATISSITMFMVLVVIAINTKLVPMHIAAVVGALIILATKVMTIKDAVAAIDWNCLLLVGALSAISSGVGNSGAGNAVANVILNLLGNNPSPFLITTVMFFTAAILSQFMSNIPTILVFLPIGVSIAEQIGVNPESVAMVITLAGAASYATPFAAPQNMMTVGWTQYKFIDFVKAGLPMIFLTYIIVVALMPIFLPY